MLSRARWASVDTTQKIGIYLHSLNCIILRYCPSIHSNSNHAQQLLHLQGLSFAGYPAPVLRYMQVCHVLFQGLSEHRLEEAQENLQASQRGAWRHADAG
jgi:hypothetical protein